MSHPFSDAGEVFAYLESFTNLEKTQNYTTRTYRLDRMDHLTSRFGRPQDISSDGEGYRILHLAGSKGKGSTAAYLAGALTRKGYKTGLYTSPHVTCYKERISLAGNLIEDEVFIREGEKIRRFIETMDSDTLPGGGDPTTFELLTLLAFLVFRSLGCQWVVLETGLGGRLDATNVVNPVGVFITSIELEHTEFLGNTLAAIAGEKGGIIKPGRPVFCGILKEEPWEVIRSMAAERCAPLYDLDIEAPRRLFSTTALGEQVQITWKDGSESQWLLKMPGPHQGQNATLAALGLRTLFTGDQAFSDEELALSFSATSLPGRMESLARDGISWFLDGAHTPQSMGLTVQTFTALNGPGGILIFGTALGKSVPDLVRENLPFFSTVIISRAGTFKPEDPEKVFAQVQETVQGLVHHPEPDQSWQIPALELIPDSEEAYRRAVELSGGALPVLTTGSFYMVAAIRRCLLDSEEVPCR
jgi:dihydrofolate synthase/folylpolyglutamate synthase